MKKRALYCCFIQIVFIELNLSFAFLLIRKTWGDQFAGNVGKCEILRNGVGGMDLSNWGDDFEMGG